jgi:predicted small secreted protein
MKKSIIFIFWLCALLISGCATQTVQQGKDLSSSGIAYTDAVNNLLDITVDRIIDFDSAELMKSRRGSNLREQVIQKNQAVVLVISEIDTFRIQTKLLKTYFLNLQALADSPIKDDAGSAVQALSSSISKLNAVFGGKDGEEGLTDEQKKQIGALGGLVSASTHASKIKRALERDAEIIGIYLSHQENQLNTIAGILRDRFNAENDLFLEEKIIAPYVDRDQNIGASWVTNRKQWFKTRFISLQLNTAQEAARQLRGVWADILEGRTDLNSLSVLISDVNEFVTTIQALKETGKSE